MKILFWVSKFPTFSETFIRDQIIGLIDQGTDVYIYAKGVINEDEIEALTNYESYNLLQRMVDLDDYFESNKFKRLAKAIVILTKSLLTKDFKYYKASLSSKKYGALARSLRLLFRVHFILKHNIQIIHTHFGPNGNEATVFKKIGLPIKLFTTFHGYDIRLGLKKGGHIYNDLFQHANGIFSISEFNRNALLQFGAKEPLILPLLNGIDLDYYKRLDSSIPESDTIKFLSVARLVEEKAIHIAINALSILKKEQPYLNFEYNIIGEGDKRAELQNLINTLGFKKYIKLLGALPSKDVRDFMQNSQVFLLSSVSEALPTVLLEAQAAELVVVSTDVGSIKDTLKGGFLVAPSNVEDFKKGLEKLLSVKPEWQELALKGRDYVTENHDIKNQTKKLLNFYKSN